MNARSEGTSQDPAARNPEGHASRGLPSQSRRKTAPAGPAGPVPTADPLHGTDTVAVADAATTENLLRCWVRENDLPDPGGDLLRIPFDASGATLLVPVRHWSPTGAHRFGPPRLEGVPESSACADALTVTALISRQAGHGAPDGRMLRESAALAGRVADSLQCAAAFLADRRETPHAPPGTGPFLDGEQALVLGHPLHPTPKSREGFSDTEFRAYSPEFRGSFPLHWIAVSRSLLAHDSAWTERGRTVPAEQLAARLAGAEPAARLPEHTVPLPLHPWQAREAVRDPQIARLLERGLLHDLGPSGDPWYPTSSVRTVMRPGSNVMLKLSLGVRITNSRRNNLRKELLRGIEVHRLLRSGLGPQWQAAHPGFDIVRDAAWLGLDGPHGQPLPGLDTVVRHNPFGPGDDAVCVAGLTALRPWPGLPDGVLRSRLADVVEKLAARSRRPVPAVAAEWFLRYLDAVVSPVLWLDAHAGIALEAHQQNTVVLLDTEGWPCGGRYRDNQGYYFRTSHRRELQQRLPGGELGIASDSFVEDPVVDERFAYYLGINNVLGLIGAFGAQGLADERLLLAAFRRFLEGQTKTDNGAPVSPLPARLLETPSLACKANLLTRLHGMDELAGPVETQSVYVPLSNPLVR